ncbi:EF-hand calcium-binding domain-containing protein 3-like [Ailuropoda melanoleuca]|uniref:EF-hand calcium-binding domain-containing protein 3-like n=1 Tax=Ailuropoda melanoleuca TaxID=9646 RepID=UPI001494B675|nr:EF-hand calcium-binding domain-containing protein 3-like [Ailuropoda melanoleuca]
MEGSQRQKTKRSPSSAQGTSRPPPQPRRLFRQDPGGEQRRGVQKGRPQQPTALLTQRQPASAKATGAEQSSQRPGEFRRLAATSSAQSGSGSQSSSDENLLPLTARQLAAFQEIFKLFSSSPTGTVDMHSMKATLHHVGIQLSPQEMCKALQRAELDGQARNSRFCDPQGLQTLFLEMLFKLMSQGFLPHKVVQEVMSYYTKKQRALRVNPGWKGRSRGGTMHTHAGLTFFCQAARLGGLSSAELERSLHRLHKAGAHSPYSQIPNLAGRTPQKTGRGTEPRAPTSDFPSPASPAATSSRSPRGLAARGSWASH